MAQYAILIYAKNPADTETPTTGAREAHSRYADEVVAAGFYVVEAHDLDAAVGIARRNPITLHGGGVEVRPVEGGFIVDRSANG